MIVSSFCYKAPYFTDEKICQYFIKILEELELPCVYSRDNQVIDTQNVKDVIKIDTDLFRKWEIGEYEIDAEYDETTQEYISKRKTVDPFFTVKKGSYSEYILFIVYGGHSYSKCPQAIGISYPKVLNETFCHNLVENSSFNFGYEIDRRFLEEQNCDSIEMYSKNYGKKEGLKIVKNIRNEYSIDTRQNLGRLHALNYFNFTVAWRMWFGNYVLGLLPEAEIINAAKAIGSDVIFKKYGDVLMLQLYEKPEDIHKPDVRLKIEKFRELLNLDNFINSNKLKVDLKFESSNFKQDGKIYKRFLGKFTGDEIKEFERNEELFELSFSEKLRFRFSETFKKGNY